MTLDDQACDSSEGEEDPWEVIDDDGEATPLATPRDDGAAAAVPDDRAGEATDVRAGRASRRLDADAPSRAGDGGGMIGGGSFAAAVSTVAAGDRRETGDGDAEEGEDDADDAREGDGSPDPKEEEREGVLAAHFLAHYDEKLMRWVFPPDGAAGAAEPMAPPPPELLERAKFRALAEEEKREETCDVAFDPDSAQIVSGDRPPNDDPDKYACTTPLLTNDEKTEESLVAVESEKDLNEKLPSGSDPVANPAETSDGAKSEVSVLVDSLANLGFEKGLVENTIEDLRRAGAEKIDHESVIDGMATADSPEGDEEKSENSKLLESLINMGFEREHIEQAIDVLSQEGAKEIDEDAVIDEIERKKNDDGHPWDPFVEFSARDLRLRNRLIRRRTRRVARDVGLSARELWADVRGESARLRADLKARCDGADLPERTARAAAGVLHAAASAGDAICRANEEYRVADKLATAAAVGGATLLVLGNPRAGVGVIAAAGATLAAGEAMKKSSARSSSTYTRDYGLREGLHID